MKTRIVEATNGPQNWGKFLIGECDHEWTVKSRVSQLPRPLLAEIGHDPRELLVLDLQTGEGAFFMPGGLASADLHKHRIWVCPLFEPFLTWLYGFVRTQPPPFILTSLPSLVDLPHAPFAMQGYRREGRTP